MEQRVCRSYCQNSFQPSKFQPAQTVCSNPACQRRRANDYHRRKVATWTRRGHLLFPYATWDEHMTVERKDGSLWMLARTTAGLMQSTSTDGGRTWATPSLPPQINHPVSRFHIRRLASGRILLIKHGETIDTHQDQSLAYLACCGLSEFYLSGHQVPLSDGFPFANYFEK